MPIYLKIKVIWGGMDTIHTPKILPQGGSGWQGRGCMDDVVRVGPMGWLG